MLFQMAVPDCARRQALWRIHGSRFRSKGMHMLRLRYCTFLLAMAVLTVPLAAAQQAAQQKAPAPAADEVDPDALAALAGMGTYLRTLRAFGIASRTTTEHVMEDGSKLQFDGTADLKVRVPDRLRVDISSDRKQRQIYYDGKSVTVYGPRVKYYATVAAPPTLRETIEELAKKYGIEFPLADLFYWGTEKAPVTDIKSARYIGPATIDGKPTEHYAFRQEGVDWQIWIQQGKTPLPLKLAITSTAQAAAPTHTAWLRWNLSPAFQAADYAFKPPPGAMKIALQTSDGKVAGSK
jgi:hypothetical protein